MFTAHNTTSSSLFHLLITVTPVYNTPFSIHAAYCVILFISCLYISHHVVLFFFFTWFIWGCVASLMWKRVLGFRYKMWIYYVDKCELRNSLPLRWEELSSPAQSGTPRKPRRGSHAFPGSCKKTRRINFSLTCWITEPKQTDSWEQPQPSHGHISPVAHLVVFISDHHGLISEGWLQIWLIWELKISWKRCMLAQ